MKRSTAITLVLLAGFCTAGALQAQSYDVRANVPFNFIVGSKQLPAGSYRFFPDGDYTIVIQNRNQPIAVLSMISFESDAPRNVSTLAFKKYGDHYFLSEIRCARAAKNVEIPRSKLEKKAQDQQASLESSQILVAAE
jgi:hypothetical protein